MPAFTICFPGRFIPPLAKRTYVIAATTNSSSSQHDFWPSTLLWPTGQHDYFETEDDKLRYFCEGLGVERQALPAKLYLGTRNPSITSRYFVDKFPMFLTQGTLSPIVTFTYIVPEAQNLVAFVTHLQNYLPLFRNLKQFNFLFLSPCEPLFPNARAIFSSMVKSPLET